MGVYNPILRVIDDDNAVSTDTTTVTISAVDVYVDDDNIAGPWDGTITYPYQTIQDGIDAVTSSTVYVFSGTYMENIVIKELDTIKVDDG